MGVAGVYRDPDYPRLAVLLRREGLFVGKELQKDLLKDVLSITRGFGFGEHQAPYHTATVS